MRFRHRSAASRVTRLGKTFDPTAAAAVVSNDPLTLDIHLLGEPLGFSGGFLVAAGIAVGLAVVALLAMPAQRANGQARLHMH